MENSKHKKVAPDNSLNFPRAEVGGPRAEDRGPRERAVGGGRRAEGKGRGRRAEKEEPVGRGPRAQQTPGLELFQVGGRRAELRGPRTGGGGADEAPTRPAGRTSAYSVNKDLFNKGINSIS